MELDLIKNDVTNVVNELLENIDINNVKVIVLGCSTSEIIGSSIGKNTSEEVGEVVVKTIKNILNEHNIELVVQGCEHINRALVVELEYALKNNLEQVNVRPVLQAGGGVATAAYKLFSNPVVVEYVQVDAGIDIGVTLIGMHIKSVVIPLRLKSNKIGQASVHAAKRRNRLIGGLRAKYQD